ncbi:carboxymuconolactone decarboxylase family protein [Muricoccus pecuniae]|uniref:Alkylhydroperoxidase/carboxymuconolactone decarboxylase family protein YurZ n=1 Tax=Muricoccus pecuniae TaxID=693023 RepID=A0A840YGB2_9PROT|nr:carboxymuconolactone decarboxylase family protein [Roseomonas pecuniae]MBB5695291.1 alkylhydroperoxidase/carboxymuconolactone decarboxylase family protein YurZ [Roseomonas pecuniae]
MSDERELPAAAGAVARAHPDLYRAYAALGEACAAAGPIDRQAQRLVKLALAIGAGLEGGVHSQCRRALAEGVPKEALKQVALMAIPTLGFPRAVAALTWIEDLTDPETRRHRTKP